MEGAWIREIKPQGTKSEILEGEGGDQRDQPRTVRHEAHSPAPEGIAAPAAFTREAIVRPGAGHRPGTWVWFGLGLARVSPPRRGEAGHRRGLGEEERGSGEPGMTVVGLNPPNSLRANASSWGSQSFVQGS